MEHFKKPFGYIALGSTTKKHFEIMLPLFYATFYMLENDNFNQAHVCTLPLGQLLRSILK
jgi:hypothetical protein